MTIIKGIIDFLITGIKYILIFDAVIFTLLFIVSIVAAIIMEIKKDTNREDGA